MSTLVRRSLPLVAALLLAAPLLTFSQAPSLSATSCSASPGQEVEIPITLITGGAEICAVSADLQFDGSRLAFVSASAGPAASAAGKNLVSQPLGAGGVRLALIGYNTIPIHDGLAFVARLRVQGTAPGGIGVGIRGGAATCAGADLPPFSASAAVNVKGGGSGEGEGGPKKGDSEPSDETSGDKGDPGVPPSGTAQTTVASEATSGASADAPSDEEASESEGAEESPRAEEAPKPLSAKAVVTPKKGPSPLKVSYRAQVEGGKKPYTYAWEFGDESEPGKKVREVHPYPKPGSYRATLEVKDADGESLTVECDEVLVQEPPVPELLRALLVKGEESWSLELTGKKFQKGCRASVGDKEYETEFADAQRVLVKGLPDPKSAPLSVSLSNPYGKACAPVQASPKPESPSAGGGAK